MPRYYSHLSALGVRIFATSVSGRGEKGDAMITSDELMSHAARCTRLAQASKDKAVAEKFGQLARDYCDLATGAITCANARTVNLPSRKDPPSLVRGQEGLSDGRGCVVQPRSATSAMTPGSRRPAAPFDVR